MNVTPDKERALQIEVPTRSRTQFLDVTRKVERAVRRLGLAEGAVLVYVPHTTAGVTINENADPSVVDDMAEALDRLVPRAGPYRHAEGNAAAHVKAALTGSSVTVPVTGGRLALGTWQGIFLAEFDGPRRRLLVVKPLSLP